MPPRGPVPGLRRVPRARHGRAGRRRRADLQGDRRQRSSPRRRRSQAPQTPQAPPQEATRREPPRGSTMRTQGKRAIGMTAEARREAGARRVALRPARSRARRAGLRRPSRSARSESTTTETQAGGHPDLSASFSLAEPGMPEAAENVSVNLPEGVFGNPNAIPTCTVSDFALSQCPPTSQAGVVTVRANYAGDPEFLLGTAPVYDIEVQSEGETARLAFIVPPLNIPISSRSRSGPAADYGLRMTVAGITQLDAARRGRNDHLGLPGGDEARRRALPPGLTGQPGGLPGRSDGRAAPRATARLRIRREHRRRSRSSTTRASARGSR